MFVAGRCRSFLVCFRYIQVISGGQVVPGRYLFVVSRFRLLQVVLGYFLLVVCCFRSFLARCVVLGRFLLVEGRFRSLEESFQVVLRFSKYEADTHLTSLWLLSDQFHEKKS